MRVCLLVATSVLVFEMLAWKISKPGCSLARTVRWVSITSESTPNPNATMFWVDKGVDILGKGAKSISFQDRYSCSVSPLASALFKVNGVGCVLLGSNYITVTKQAEFDWQVMKPSIELVLSQVMEAKIPIIRPDLVEKSNSAASSSGSAAQPANSIESKIVALIAERVQPFVQQDGGDIEFVSFDEKSGVVQLRMVGACKGCPKSMITLKMGIERMLKHYVPEVVGVIDIGGSSGSEGIDKEKAKEFGP